MTISVDSLNNAEVLPGAARRIKAAFTDGIILMALMVVFSQILALFETVPDAVRILGFIFIFILYDPLFTSFLGGTVGHMIMGIRVKKQSDLTENIILPLAVVRFICKAILGWVSLLTIGSSRKNLAIHDMAVKSIVIYK